MYAIVEIAGKQFKVEKDKYIYTHRLDSEAGSSVTFDKVMFVDNSGKIMIGLPALKGASVTGKVLEHLKDDKVIVFKKKRRKGYQKWNNHRQYLTQILIQGILTKGETVKEELTAEKAVRKTLSPSQRNPKVRTEVVAEKEAPVKKAEAKKAPAKKAVKKTED